MSLPAILAASAALENLNLVALGINHAYDEPPEVLTDLPVAIRFAEPTQRMEASDSMGRYNIFHFKIEVHLARGILQDSYASALSVIRAYQNLYAANLSIGGTCDVCGFREPACEGPVRLRYGTDVVETIGIVFYMEAKEILDDITVGFGVTFDYRDAFPLKTGQTTCYAIGDDGDVEAGVAKAYTVNALADTSDIEVAHYAAATLSFTAPGTIADAANGLTAWFVNDRMVIKGSASNDGEVTVTGIGGAPANLTISAAVNEIAGATISLYKVAAHSNNVVQDTKTGIMWSRNTSTGEAVGPASIGTLYWINTTVGTGICTLHNAANTVSCIAASNIFRIIGGAGEINRFHVGDAIDCIGFANAVNNHPGYYVESVTVNGLDLDIVVDPSNQVLIAEGAVGDAIYLVCRSIWSYTAGARNAGLSGYTDWRPPNLTELNSIRDWEVPNALPDAVAFPGWPANLVWTSTTSPSATANAMYIDFGGERADDTARGGLWLAALVRLGTG